MGSEYGALVMTAATDVKVSIIPGPGARIEKVFRSEHWAADPETGKIELELPPILDGEPAHIPFRLGWSVDAGLAPFAVVTLECRIAATGEFVVEHGDASVQFGDRRAGPEPQAVKHLTLSKVSLMLHALSRADTSCVQDLLQRINRLQGEVRVSTEYAGVAGDPQVQAAMEMLRLAGNSVSAGTLSLRRACCCLSTATFALAIRELEERRMKPGPRNEGMGFAART
jgi:hypothetical protein